MKKPKRPSKVNHSAESEVFNVRLPHELVERLKKQAEKEDRSKAYLVRVFVQAGLDDRARA